MSSGRWLRASHHHDRLQLTLKRLQMMIGEGAPEATAKTGQSGDIRRTHQERRSRLRLLIATITIGNWLLWCNDTTNLRRSILTQSLVKHHHFLREALNFKDE